MLIRWKRLIIHHYLLRYNHLLLLLISHLLISNRGRISNRWSILYWLRISNWWTSLNPLYWLLNILYRIRKNRFLRNICILNTWWNNSDRWMRYLIGWILNWTLGIHSSLCSLFIGCISNWDLLIRYRFCFAFLFNPIIYSESVLFLFFRWTIIWLWSVIITFLLHSCYLFLNYFD